MKWRPPIVVGDAQECVVENCIVTGTGGIAVPKFRQHWWQFWRARGSVIENCVFVRRSPSPPQE